MANFAQWLNQQRWPRVALVAVLFPLGLLGLVSAAVVVMTSILQGPRVALADCAVALALLLGVTLVAGGQPAALLPGAGLSWGLAILVGTLTGRYRSLVLAVQSVLLAGLAGVLLFTAVVGDVSAFWQRSLQELAAELVEMGMQLGGTDALAPLAPVMTGLLAASAVTSSLLALIIGAWWAGAAGGPGMGEMFVKLRLGRVVGLLTAGLGIAVTADLGQLPASLLLVLGTGFAAQGLAVIHWQARKRNWPWFVLFLVYLPLLLGPSILAIGWFLVTALGFVDNWYSLRRVGEDVI